METQSSGIGSWDRPVLWEWELEARGSPVPLGLRGLGAGLPSHSGLVAVTDRDRKSVV